MQIQERAITAEYFPAGTRLAEKTWQRVPLTPVIRDVWTMKKGSGWLSWVTRERGQG
jgi:hypothetical protein